MSRQLSEVQKILIKDASGRMTCREAAKYAGVDQKTLLKYGFKPRGYLVKVKLGNLIKGDFLKTGEPVTIDEVMAQVKKELELKNDIDARDLQGKLDLLVQCKFCAYDGQNKAYYVPMAA